LASAGNPSGLFLKMAPSHFRSVAAGDGHPLDCANKYTIHFDKNATCHVSDGRRVLNFDRLRVDALQGRRQWGSARQKPMPI
jgi:hypothetical protein